ncbi:flagellin [Brevinema andersonii]|uniref:Flagellin n=1 Tax=Brevinema andersonii TaxID=34097 RepID=A0A1I1DJR5_BREAD|nr:flagellin [Brevinema andersonii]SFB75097.1 flagellin [Brevinema andersonii]
MIINNNISAIFGNRQLALDNAMLNKNMEKLSSGFRINRAGDDASGLAVSEKMRTQIRGLNQALRNTQDGVSFIQTTEGYLQEVTNALQRIRELAIQGANGIYSDEDRGYIQVEVEQMVDEINRVGSQAQFNGLKMLTGLFAKPTADSTPPSEMYLHLGANMDERVQVYIATMNSFSLGLQNEATNEIVSVSTQDQANLTIGMIDQALRRVNSQRADLGGYQNRLESASRSIMVGAENLQAAESRIRDTDMARESSMLAKNQVLTQAAIAMLAQANQQPQAVLQLLR